MLTQQQKNLKKMIKELGLKYEKGMFDSNSIYIEKDRKIKDILFYLLNYEVIDDYIKIGDYIAVYNGGIQDIHLNYYDTGKTKIELYKVE